MLTLSRAGRTTELERREQEIGFKYSETSWLYDPRRALDIISAACDDWMHIYFVKGICHVEANAVIDSLGKVFGFKRFKSYVELWTWPRSYANGDVCVTDTAVNGTASEMMSLAPLLLRYLVSVRHGASTDAVASAVACCEIVESLVQHVSTPERLLPDYLRSATERFLQLHFSCYGSDNWLPKHHWSLHLPQALQRFKKLVTCFHLERRHNILKRFCNGRVSKLSYEQCVMEDMTVQQLDDFGIPFERTCFKHPIKATTEILEAVALLDPSLTGNVFTSTVAVANGRCIAWSDFVYYTGADGLTHVGRICFHDGTDDEHFSCIERWTIVDQNPPGDKCRNHHSQCVVPVIMIIDNAIYQLSGNVTTLLVPVSVRASIFR